MHRILALAAAAAGAAVLLTAPSASAADGAVVCVSAHVDVNGNAQSVEQCLPPESR